MKLSQLLSGVPHAPDLSGPGRDPEITGVACDSRLVRPGDLFAALPGARADGRRFAAQAVAAGAAAVLLQAPDAPGGTASDPLAQTVSGPLENALPPGEGADIPPNVPVVPVPDARKALALASAAFYGHPARRLTMVGITGTKGKTTTAHILKAILEAGGHKTAMVGTLGSFIGPRLVEEAENTTPESLTLHRFFARAVEEGCSHLVMEVSSQGLKLSRTYGIQYDLALFLNLSPDHIGGAEHRDFAEYLACKSLLFRQCRQAAANRDDPRRGEVLAGCPAPVSTFGFSPGADVRGGAVRPLREAALLGSEFSVSCYAAPVRFAMPGPFNAADALAAIAAAQVLGLPEEAVRRGLETVSVPGRTQLVPCPGGFTVLIDYAHNDVSFASLLSTLRDYEHRSVIAVFGAGGNRPRMRRRDMAREAARYADFAVITADNPRWERVEDICRDITDALDGAIPCVELYDREAAIRFALDMARPGDFVALLGKGHEEYIEADGVRTPFSERAVVAAWAAEHTP